MYANNLSHAQLETYLKLLTLQDMLANNSDRYKTTEKGRRFLEAFAHLTDLLDDRARRAFLEHCDASTMEIWDRDSTP